MNMTAVALEDRSAAQVSPPNRKAYINQRQSKSHQRGNETNHRACVLTPYQPKASQHKSDRETATIPQKNRGGVEVVAEEREQAPCQRNSCRNQPQITAEYPG